MAISNTFQEGFISASRKILESCIPPNLNLKDRNDYKLSILEKCSAIIGGFDYAHYCDLLNIRLNKKVAKTSLDTLVRSILDLKLSPGLVLSILSTEDIATHDQKTKGAYYTDFRLAMALAESFDPLCRKKSLPNVIDISCGSGILLNAMALRLSKKFKVKDILSKSIFGVDLSPQALRGTMLSLASLTNDLKAIRKLQTHLKCFDSLSADPSVFPLMCPEGFDGVIGNPPWEKLKINIHEYLQSQGQTRHYGETSQKKDSQGIHIIKDKLKSYTTSIKHLVPELRSEIDLYMPFLKLSLNLAKPGGLIGQLLPASLIRNQGTTWLRKYLLANTSRLSITILDNGEQFFAIDSRFKFLMISGTRGKTNQAIQLSHASVKNNIIHKNPGIQITHKELELLRPDLSLPEVKDQTEWEIFKKLSAAHSPFAKKGTLWDHSYNREVDMSLDKSHFRKSKESNLVPVVEGRMIHQFRTGVKSYISGSGRKAVWDEEMTSGVSGLKPQFFIAAENISSKHIDRMQSNRAAFCDITGQTNERTMLSTLIPAGCICGNKVPTIDFYRARQFPDLAYVWIALSNSFVFDWMIRRTITTNANFFIVDQVPVPLPDPEDYRYTEMARLSKEIIDSPGSFDWETAISRAKIDALSAILYGLSFDEFVLILRDFSSIDRLQPNIHGETKSTITKDLALASFLQLKSKNVETLSLLNARVEEYKKIGAIAYVPSQFIHLSQDRKAMSYGIVKSSKSNTNFLSTSPKRRYTEIF